MDAEIRLIGFGTFKKAQRAARKGRNPQTGEVIDIAASGVNYPKSREILAQIPKERYIDFFTFAEGRYAYYGENPWVNGHKVKMSKPHIERRKVQYQEPEDISPELFMDMFAQANPLWIPPPRSNIQLDTREFITQYIPQRDLQELLFDRPKLRKQVINEFRRRM